MLYAGCLSLHGSACACAGELPFAGWADLARLFQDGVFWLALQHTVIFVAVSVALEDIVGLAIALVAE